MKCISLNARSLTLFGTLTEGPMNRGVIAIGLFTPRTKGILCGQSAIFAVKFCTVCAKMSHLLRLGHV